MKILAAVLAAAALLPGVASAQIYTEINAGQTLATASDTATPATGASLTTINGSLTSLDADLYRIYISAPGAFSATTNNALTNNSYPGGGPLDTALFLFDWAGHAIASNDDDANGLDLTSTLSPSNALLSNLAAGYYYLGISISGNEPVNSVNQLLFQTGSTTATRGPASGLNPTTLADFDGNTYDPTPGAYQINLTGVAVGPAAVAGVPEPATWAMMVLGFGAIGAGLRRRTTGRRAASAA
jgi:hypothetical protein